MLRLHLRLPRYYRVSNKGRVLNDQQSFKAMRRENKDRYTSNNVKMETLKRFRLLDPQAVEDAIIRKKLQQGILGGYSGLCLFGCVMFGKQDSFSSNIRDCTLLREYFCDDRNDPDAYCGENCYWG